MDRYWISREQKGLNKVVIPSMDEFKKYAQTEKSVPKDTPLENKADLCAEIVKLKHPKITGKELVKRASALMTKSMSHLLILRETLLHK